MRKAPWFCYILAVLLLFGLSACSSKAPEEAPAPEAAEAETASAPEEQVSGEYQPGTVDGAAYENRLLGYGCYLDGWTYDEAAPAADGMRMDMSAQSDDGMYHVSVQFQQRPLAEVMETLQEGELSESFVDAGYERVQVSLETVTFGSESRDCVTLYAEIEGIPVAQRQVLVDCGDYTAFITATAYLGAAPDEILMRFYPL